jgi:hypothetical protein
VIVKYRRHHSWATILLSCALAACAGFAFLPVATQSVTRATRSGRWIRPDEHDVELVVATVNGGHVDQSSVSEEPKAPEANERPALRRGPLVEVGFPLEPSLVVSPPTFGRAPPSAA